MLKNTFRFLNCIFSRYQIFLGYIWICNLGIKLSILFRYGLGFFVFLGIWRIWGSIRRGWTWKIFAPKLTRTPTQSYYELNSAKNDSVFQMKLTCFILEMKCIITDSSENIDLAFRLGCFGVCVPLSSKVFMLWQERMKGKGVNPHLGLIPKLIPLSLPILRHGTQFFCE